MSVDTKITVFIKGQFFSKLAGTKDLKYSSLTLALQNSRCFWKSHPVSIKVSLKELDASEEWKIIFLKAVNTKGSTLHSRCLQEATTFLYCLCFCNAFMLSLGLISSSGSTCEIYFFTISCLHSVQILWIGLESLVAFPFSRSWRMLNCSFCF